MNKIIYIVFLLSIYQFQIDEYLGEDDGTYSNYLLSLYWPGGLCKVQKCLNHGLWPSKMTSSPEYCKRLNFKKQDITEDLKLKLQNNWVSYYQNDQWKYIFKEMKKHATCWNPEDLNFGSMDPKVAKIMGKYSPEKSSANNYNTYLELSLYLTKKYDIYQAFYDNEITPGYRYKIDDIIYILKRRYRKNAFLPICVLNNYKIYLIGIRICLDLNFNLIACDNMEFSRNLYKCSKRYKVEYPKFDESSWLKYVINQQLILCIKFQKELLQINIIRISVSFRGNQKQLIQYLMNKKKDKQIHLQKSNQRKNSNSSAKNLPSENIQILSLMLKPVNYYQNDQNEHLAYYCSEKYQSIEKLISKSGQSLKIKKSSIEYRLILSQQLRKKSIKKTKRNKQNCKCILLQYQNIFLIIFFI